MDNFRKIDKILKSHRTDAINTADDTIISYAKAIAMMEQVIAVLSDLRLGNSRIFYGNFSKVLGATEPPDENSIWEKEILGMMPKSDCDEKYLAELRFYNFLRRISKSLRSNYYLATKLRFNIANNKSVDVLHRMYYIYGETEDTLNYALCLYGPMTFDFPGRSVAINSVTGQTQPLTSESDTTILSRREKQVLQMIANGRTSKEIAEALTISIHTVSRHRQDILAKLQVKNSLEACQLARSLALIS